MPSIRAITLDLDDTLWPVQPALEQADLAVDAWLREHWPAVAARWPVPALRRLREEVARSRPDLAHDFSAQRRLTLERAFAACGVHEPPVEAAWAVYFAARNAVRPYPDSHPALARLAGRLPLASLTNGNADLRLTGLEAHFRHHVCAREVGCAKPDPRIFHVAARRLGVAPDELLHVGDDPWHDVHGARAAGLHCAWINRDGRPWPASLGEPPAWVFADLAGLTAWLDRQLAAPSAPGAT
ncbi:HAD family hydrolase [Aerosticca soli]|uniref:FMN hydrolase n=1 Tax=Aerosticca soli TaxID=2010829 RepID=A0A2Z6E6P8_9GAMM|nr:HAD family hydrolase [Aerosticca soli]BBD80845.1 FMN hydrolase [Aerosticca soli]